MAEDLNAQPDEAFRARARSFVEKELPAELRHPPKRLHLAQNRPWYDILARTGWLAPGWPPEFGGMGLSPAKQVILIEEFERAGAPRLNDHGITMVGPLLIRHGTKQQQEFFLPKVLSGAHIWCQGYSEPNAGSDLASLRTEAVPDGDEYVVTGQKIWTTLAGDANWIFLLVRTDKVAKKQEGISFLLVPMDSPGITVKPIISLDRHDEFSEVFFDAVRVSQANRVGAENDGWSMAKALLSFERIFLGSPRQPAHALSRLKLLAERLGVFEDPVFQESFTRHRLDLADGKALYAAEVAKLARGEPLGPEVSMLKVWMSELYQRISETMLEIAGETAALEGPMEGNFDVAVAGTFITARAPSIYGGTNEIQRNILAKEVLRLG
jgi:alkylation response protein AidB-like acyl-CoA dehydrogenase